MVRILRLNLIIPLLKSGLRQQHPVKSRQEYLFRKKEVFLLSWNLSRRMEEESPSDRDKVNSPKRNDTWLVLFPIKGERRV